MKRGTGEPEKQGAGKEMVSHGICPRCAKKLRAEAKALRAYHEKRESGLIGLTGLAGLMTGETGDFAAGDPTRKTAGKSSVTPPGLTEQVTELDESRV
jgi:hypothetical protein